MSTGSRGGVDAVSNYCDDEGRGDCYRGEDERREGLNTQCSDVSVSVRSLSVLRFLGGSIWQGAEWIDPSCLRNEKSAWGKMICAIPSSGDLAACTDNAAKSLDEGTSRIFVITEVGGTVREREERREERREGAYVPDTTLGARLIYLST